MPSVGAGGVQAEERNALARLLEIDPMRLAVEVQPQIAADHRLDDRRADVRGTLRRSGRTQCGEELLEEQQVAAIGHHVALDLEMAHALHADQALEADGRHRLGELRPALRRGAKAEGGAGRGAATNGNALAHRHRNRLVAVQHGERQGGEPGAPLQRFVAVEGSRADARSRPWLSCPA